MATTCDCPDPPGGSVTCSDDQVAICRVTDGKPRSRCVSVPAAIATALAEQRDKSAALQFLSLILSQAEIARDVGLVLLEPLREEHSREAHSGSARQLYRPASSVISIAATTGREEFRVGASDTEVRDLFLRAIDLGLPLGFVETTQVSQLRNQPLWRETLIALVQFPAALTVSGNWVARTRRFGGNESGSQGGNESGLAGSS